MKVRLDYDNDGYTFSLEPEKEMEKCAVAYLAYRPTNQVKILITRLGVFMREEKKNG